jgi:hypothetical protein
MLIMVHTSAVILLTSFAVISILYTVLTAVKPGIDQANEWLVKIAHAIWVIENIAVGIVILTGLIAMYIGSWPLSKVWVWMSLLIMVFYSVTLIYVAKPERQALAKGGSGGKVIMQVLLHFGYVLLIAFAFSLMMFKPF